MPRLRSDPTGSGGRRRRARRWITFLVGQVHRVRRSPDSLLWTLRITAAATASYALADLLFDSHQPLVAPLTAMLVVQVTPLSLLETGIERVGAVVLGVTVAVLFADQFPLTWWSLALVIGAALLVGQAFGVRDNLVEVPISALLVLGGGAFGAEAAAWERLTETLLGALFGVGANLLFPPQVATADAGRAIEDLASAQAGLLRRAAAFFGAQVEADQVASETRSWLLEARGITHDVPSIDDLLDSAEAGRRLNLSALGTSNVAPGLRQGLEALEHTAVALRAMFRSLSDAAASDEWQPTREDHDLLARTFDQLGDLVATFGTLVRDEASRGAASVEAGKGALADLDQTVVALHKTRSDLEDHRRAAEEPVDIELTVSVTSTVRRLLRELDLKERMARQVQLHRTRRTGRARQLPPSPVAADRQHPLDPGAPTEVIQAPKAGRRRPGPQHRHHDDTSG